MKKDYHMHPTVVADQSRFDAFAKIALSRGIEEVCITDHMPLDGSTASDRLKRGEVAAYCRTVREIAKRYEGVLSVKCGIEVDYHPSVLDQIHAVLSEGDFDFVLGSTHMHLFAKDYFDGAHTQNQFAEAALKNTLAAVESGMFHSIAHFDMFRWVFSAQQRFALKDDGYCWTIHKGAINAILDAIKQKGIFLEINSHFASSHGDLALTYPVQDIVALALQKGLRFSFGSDAHKAENVGAMYEELRAHPIYGAALRQWEGDCII